MTSAPSPDTYRGPYADGPPPEALAVDRPSLRAFGFAEVRRMLVIAAVMAGCLARALGRALLHPRRLLSAGPTTDPSTPAPTAPGPRRQRAAAGLQAAAATGVVDAFCALGPTFVKLGQLMGSSPSICPAALSDAARRCIREAGPLDVAVVRRAIEADLGRPVAELFADFEDRPLSAASVAQVHGCVLPDGRQAVVKIQRPGIRRTMISDLRIQWRMMGLLERVSGFARDANVTGAIEDLHEVTCNELNFVVEAQRQSRFRDRIWAYGDNDAVTAPEVYWNWCGPSLICMERLFGVPIDDFDAVRTRNGDGKLSMRRGVKVWMEACLVHGPFHGDVHAGNIWILDDGRVAFLDFGIMGELTDDWKGVMRDFFHTSAIDNDFARVARAFKRVGAFPADAGPDEDIGASMKMIFGPMFDAGLGEVPMASLLAEIIRTMGSLAGRAGTPKELQLILKQLLYFERYSKEFAPDWPMFRDLYLMRNVFPDEVATQVAASGVALPD